MLKNKHVAKFVESKLFMVPYENALSFAQNLDYNDPVKDFRHLFHIPQYQETNSIYLCGNSLGLQPKTSRQLIEKELLTWEKFGVEGHFEGSQAWWQYRKPMKPLLATIVGCKATEATIMNNLTTNLHLMLVSFYRPLGKRTKVLMESGAFPSDQYALETHLRTHGIDPNEAIVELSPRPKEATLLTENILQTIEELRDELALVMLGGVNYYTGQAFELEKITKKAQEVGAIVGFDLAHAAGNIPLHLHDWNVDFAVWCSYKYLNSGPGGVAGAYIHERHHQADTPRYAGWWGQIEEERFLMKKGFRPMIDADGWQLSNEPILLMAAHQAALEIFQQAGIERLHQKSQQLTGYLYYLLSEHARQWIDIITPAQTPHRGCQLSVVAKKNGKQLHQHLQKKGIITDWREPNVLRMAPVPLYNTYEEVWKTAQAIINF